MVLQLKWTHQFQFAGYYAAQAKGFYREAGLKVIIRESRPGLVPAEEVVSGRAQFGVEGPSLLVERMIKKRPVVVLAAIFQHSPEVVLALGNSGIRTPHDLIGRRIMYRKKTDAEVLAMLRREGVPLDQITALEHTWNIEDLISKRVDAMSAYITDRPFALKQRHIPFTVLRPLTYGIDFYGDCLFTSERQIRDNPQLVKKFLQASLKGWAYAMEHPDEIVNLILSTYSRRMSRQELLYEAEAMQQLLLPRFIEIGHMNPGRWRHIADTMVSLGMLNRNYSLSGFLYEPNPFPDHAGIVRALWVLALLIILSFTGGLVLFLFNRRLTRLVNEKTRELRKAQLFTDAVINSLPGVFYVYEEGKRLIRWNKNLERELGLTAAEMYGAHPLDWFQGEAKEQIRSILSQITEKQYVEAEARVTLARGEIPYYFTGAMVKIEENQFLVGVGIDLSQKKRLEEMLLQAQKMESVGRLAGGIAHDFNNILSSIIGYSELLLSEVPDDSPYRSEIQLIHKAGEKAAVLTRQLLAFSRKQILEKKTVSVNRIIDDMIRLLGKILGEDIQIQVCLEARNDLVEADPGQIEQVLVNLGVNARDAMPDGGRLIIETRDVHLDQATAGAYPSMEPGLYVMIAVTDFGAGMSQDVMNKIFDPFFTTKELGKGTGLGLATVHGIVEQHNGQIHVYSEEGNGTTFKIYFPCSSGSLTEKDEAPLYHPRPGRETILVVDDEVSIRKLVRDTLEPLGYTCLMAANGQEALEIASGYDDRIDVLLTDVVMPGLNGRELAEKFQDRQPAATVIFMSGYTENTIAHHGILDPGLHYLPKPLTPGELTRKIQTVLMQEQATN